MSDIGLIGLGVMGSALARNFASRGISVSVCNRHVEKTQAFLDRYGTQGFQGFTKMDGFAASLPKPRKILLMVDAGAVDAVTEDLLPALESGDIIIDGGNSHFRDTIRRSERLDGKGIRFIGLGISGGEEGALTGPSMMAGGDEATWGAVKMILDKVAAKDFKGQSCAGYMGMGGAGHAVKMVHNGIEYAVMQAINDVYHFSHRACGLEPPAIAQVFDRWRKEGLDGYLMEIATDILRARDTLSDGLLIENISDVSHQKGTGRWASIEALEHDVPLPNVTVGVETRFHSKNRGERQILAALYKRSAPSRNMDKQMEERLLSALRASILSSFAQGIRLLEGLSEEGPRIDMNEALRVWQGGCIIRMGVLEDLREAYGEHYTRNVPLLQTKLMVERCGIEDLAPAVEAMTQARVPHPALSASYQWLLSNVSDPLPTTLIQGMRDYFGAHTYLRTDREGVFHTEWKKA